jgi:transcriptional regulator with XRE-family HTH domain
VTRESAHVAGLRVALGKSLADHRERNGLNKRELAERLFYARTSISKIEAGQQPAPRTFWCAADELLGADRELVVEFDALAAAKVSDGQADLLAEALVAVMLPVARGTSKVRSSSASPDQVDAVIQLEALSRALTEHSRRVMMGEPADWADITEQLIAAAATCGRRVVVRPWVASATCAN